MAPQHTHCPIGKCVTRSRRSFFQPKLTINQPGDKYEQEADAVAEKVVQGSGKGIQQNTFFKPAITPIQRTSAAEAEEVNETQGKVAENKGETSAGLTKYVRTLSGGRPLNQQERGFFEARLGYDFGQVRLHEDCLANSTAQAINAKAFTYGSNIIFSQNQYRPETHAGKKLLAHELTHVVQQKMGGSNTNVQRITCQEGATAPATVAQGQANTVDARAQAIIDRAGDQNVSIQDRATRVVSDIICAYYPHLADRVRNINYNASQTGLRTTSVGSGSNTRGDITVGDYFVNNTNRRMIARRVFQVGHELDHIGQYRSGLAGGQHADEREFLAFYRNGIADEFAGTGRMPHNMRRGIIDQALGYYYCLDATLQQDHQSKQQELLTRRQTVNGTAGNPPTDPPTSCSRQH